MTERRHSFCRVCTNYCPIVVDVVAGAVTSVTGDSANDVYHGYTCVKGRAQPAFLRDQRRLLTSQKRSPGGAFLPIPVESAMDEIAARLLEIIDAHGPSAIAGYAGTMQIATATTTGPFYNALLDAIGTPMRFDPNTIDKGGKQVAASFLGTWMAPPQGFDRPEVALLIGVNPLVTYTGFPAGNPGRWLGDSLRRGMQLLVIDPRRSDVARRATLHLQPAPGHDAEIVAGMIRIVLAEGLADEGFIAENVTGVDTLRRAVDGFTPDEVERHAGVAAADLVRAARIYGSARRGYAMAGTGPNMSGPGTLVEYLVLVLETVCGRWLRAGERVVAAPTLLPVSVPRAQAVAPARQWNLEPGLRTRGLSRTAAGMPTSALPDEILLEGDRKIRALICWSGNPIVAFPDQLKTIDALRSLDLLVQVDPWMSETAKFAHYVIAPTMPLEAPAVTLGLDALAMRATGYGLGESYAQYTPAIVAPPNGSDLVDEWELFYGLMTRMSYPVVVKNARSQSGQAIEIVEKPTTEELLELLIDGSRVPLGVIKAQPSGARFPEPPVFVAPRARGAHDRLDVANFEMLDDLRRIDREGVAGDPRDDTYRFRLICRRHAHVYNSSGNVPETNRGRGYNPAFLHPDDLRSLGLQPGDEVQIRSARSAIPAIVDADSSLRPGLVSMMFGFGGTPDRDGDVAQIGSSPSRLLSVDDVFDRFTGQPRMSNVPVNIVLPPGEPRRSSN